MDFRPTSLGSASKTVTLSTDAYGRVTTLSEQSIAIDGSAFLVVQTAGGERYTRAGSLQINTQGQLVTASGNPVLGGNGPIVFQPTDKAITIAADGNISVLSQNFKKRTKKRRVHKSLSFQNN